MRSFDLLPMLAGSALKGTIILGLAALAALWLRRGSAASRHMAWQMGLLGLLALPVVTFVRPFEVHIPALPSFTINSPAQRAPRVEAPAPVQNSAPPVSTEKSSSKASSDGSSPAAFEPVNEPVSAPRVSLFARVLPWLGVIWFAGVLAVLARFTLGLLVARWYTRKARPLDAIEWASMNETMSFAVGLGHPVRLLKSQRAATPMTFGVINPVVLLPGDADEWPEERRRIVLLHELAHVHRLDSLTHIFTQLACAIYWFNPLVWIAAARLRAEAERACDDWVLRAGMRASTYADHLLDMVRTIGRLHTPAAALPMAQRSTFEGRLLAILEPGLNRNGLTRGQGLLLTSIIALVVFPLAAVTPVRSQPSNESDLPMNAAVTTDHNQPKQHAEQTQQRTQTQQETRSQTNTNTQTSGAEVTPPAGNKQGGILSALINVATNAVTDVFKDNKVEKTVIQAVEHATDD